MSGNSRYLYKIVFHSFVSRCRLWTCEQPLNLTRMLKKMRTSLFLLLNVFLAYVGAQSEYCYYDDEDPYIQFSTKTAYELIRARQPQTSTPDSKFEFYLLEVWIGFSRSAFFSPSWWQTLSSRLWPLHRKSANNFWIILFFAVAMSIFTSVPTSGPPTIVLVTLRIFSDTKYILYLQLAHP